MIGTGTRAYFDRETETAAAEMLAALRLRKLRAGLVLLLQRNPFYGARLRAAGLRDARDVGSLDDLARMPFTTKSEFAADQEAAPPFGTNLTYPPSEYRRVLRTSGTTGRPLFWLETEESLRTNAREWASGLVAQGIGPGDRIFFAFSFGPFMAFWGAWEGARLVGALTISGGSQQSLDRLRLLAQCGATVLASTPTYALRLAEVAAENGIDLRALGVRATVHGGEPGASIPATKRRIEDLWGARCFDTCGLTEGGHLGFECLEAPGDVHLHEDDYVVEVIDPTTGRAARPGERGELVVTNLERWGMPALRYRTRDLVEIVDQPCDCGRTFRRLRGGIIGRADDMITVRGVNVFPSAIEAIVRRHPAIAEFVIDVHRRREMRELELRIEPVPALDAGAVTELARQVEQDVHTDLGLRATVTAVAPGALPRFELKARRLVVHD